MESKIVAAAGFEHDLPIAVILSDKKPEGALQFREDRWGCVAAMMVAASKGRMAIFDRNTFGCVGGGTGLGFGDQYEGFPIEELLSAGTGTPYRDRGRRTHLEEGEGYFRTPELAREFVRSLPMREVPARYVLLMPLEQVTEEESPELVIFFANPDQLSALIVLANYNCEKSQSAVAPFGAGCQSILYGFAESEREDPRGIIGFTDISVRKLVDREILSFTVPWKMFLEMERNVEGSFLQKDQWLDLLKRREEQVK